jgi:hypothetical protein
MVSSSVIVINAISLVSPQISLSALKSLQTLGLALSVKILHLKSLRRCMHLSPAALPLGIPGMAELIDGAIQQAPQEGLHCILIS